MNIEEYKYYSNISKNIFEYMNGKINTMNYNCSLHIDMYDYINNTYANIRYPNQIFIHVGTIIDSWENEWSKYMRKDSYIVSVIAWALSHELHHADQLISMIQYNRNIEYKKEIEQDVERASYNWVSKHSKEIEVLIGIPIVINEITSDSLGNSNNYTKATVEQFYKQTIANTIIRDMDLFNSLQVFTNDSICDDIILIFNNNEKLIIKSNGKYLAENIDKFSFFAYQYAGYWDTYHINACCTLIEKNNKRIGNVYFTISDMLIRPMVFK